MNNIKATQNLINAMKKNFINNIIFSSTAAIYQNKETKINELDKINPKSYYAKTKLSCENIIKNSGLNSIILRFFNVCSSIIKPKLLESFINLKHT